MGNGIEVIARGLWVSGDCILLCRNVAKGYFYLPGGHVEAGETAQQALAREIAEETGRQPRIGRGLAAAECLFDQAGKRRHEINLVFLVEQQGPTPEVPSLEPEIAFEWVELSQITDIDLRPAVIRDWIVESQRRGHAGSHPAIAWLSDA